MSSKEVETFQFFYVYLVLNSFFFSLHDMEVFEGRDIPLLLH